MIMFLGYIEYNKIILPITIFFGFLLFMLIHELLDYKSNKPPLNLIDFICSIRNVLLLSIFSYIIQDYMNKDTLLNISVFEHIYTIILWNFSTDIIFYYMHRFCHIKYLYIYIHKPHHKYRIARPIYCQYSNILELLIIIIPSIFGLLLIIEVQWIIATAWFVIMINHNTYSHKSSLNSNDYHGYHHLYYKYNYGNSQWIDSLHGTVFIR